MALCKDCFHREVCEHLVTWTTINLDDIPPELPCSHFKDTADVVPKSKVILASSDAMKMLIECHGYALTHDADIKKEVAREIFEEIEKVSCVYKLDGDFYLDNGLYAELKKKYTEATDGTYEKSSHPADD